MMGGRVIEENTDFYRYFICHLPSAICQRMNDKKDCELLAICDQTKYNEEKRGGDIYGKNSKCICTC